MPRPKSPAPRVFVLQVRLTDDEVAILDERRGERSRTAWAREVLVGAEVSVDAEPVADYPIGPKAVAAREHEGHQHVAARFEDLEPWGKGYRGVPVCDCGVHGGLRPLTIEERRKFVTTEERRTR